MMLLFLQILGFASNVRLNIGLFPVFGLAMSRATVFWGFLDSSRICVVLISSSDVDALV